MLFRRPCSARQKRPRRRWLWRPPRGQTGEIGSWSFPLPHPREPNAGHARRFPSMALRGQTRAKRFCRLLDHFLDACLATRIRDSWPQQTKALAELIPSATLTVAEAHRSEKAGPTARGFSEPDALRKTNRRPRRAHKRTCWLGLRAWSVYATSLRFVRAGAFATQHVGIAGDR